MKTGLALLMDGAKVSHDDRDLVIYFFLEKNRLFFYLQNNATTDVITI